MISIEQRELLDRMMSHYQGILGAQARAYLSERGLTDEAITRFRLGEADGSFTEHADLAGRIAIPYVTKLGGCVGFKFRVAHDCTDACQHAKYLTPYPTRLYNTLAFERAEKLGYIAIAEGEFDAMILDWELDIPAVGIPGVETWIQHKEWRPLFDGFTKVLVFADQDEAGRKLEARILGDIHAAVPVRLPAKDVNETFLKFGREEIRNAVQLD